MKIIIDPKWTFIEALKAAWDAYKGGLEYGVPNRTRVLEQWANVVGRRRAVSELEEALSAYKNSAEVEKYLGLSSYTVRKLRKQFKAMPVVTPFSGDSTGSPELPKQLEIRESSLSEINFALSQFLQLAQKAGVNPLSKLLTGLIQDDLALTVGESAFQQLLAISQRARVDVTARLIDWIATIAKPEEVVSVLEKLNFDDLQKLNAAMD